MDIKWKLKNTGSSHLYGKVGKGAYAVRLFINTVSQNPDVPILLTAERGGAMIHSSQYNSTIEALEAAERIGPQLVRSWFDGVCSINVERPNANYVWKTLTVRTPKCKVTVRRGGPKDVMAWADPTHHNVHMFLVRTKKSLSDQTLEEAVFLLSREYDFDAKTHAVVERAHVDGLVDTYIVTPIKKQSRLDFHYAALMKERAIASLRPLIERE